VLIPLPAQKKNVKNVDKTCVFSSKNATKKIIYRNAEKPEISGSGAFL
jgi:hypothetical protein